MAGVFARVGVPQRWMRHRRPADGRKSPGSRTGSLPGAEGWCSPDGVPPAHVILPTLLLLECPLPATAPERDDPPALYDPEKLRAWRAESGLTREQVCSMTGVSYPWLRKLERGEADPSLKLLVALARFYGHEPSELVGGPQ